MNREWASLNKAMQEQLKKKDTYKDGIDTLCRLRENIMDVILSFREELTREEFDAMPYIGADGYHSKNIAYSLWHIFRIEDIVAHTLINEDEQVFFSQHFRERIHSPIITTGNELVREQISSFTAQLDTDELYEYISQVRHSTESILKDMPYERLKEKMSPQRREALISLHTVDDSEDAFWLIDYWCGKDIRGLIQMPFSRHWIMHTEACIRIKERLDRIRR